MGDAWDKLVTLDPKTIATNSGAVLKGSIQIALRVAGDEFLIDFGTRELSFIGRTGEPSHHLQILVLHYLLGSGNAQLANRPATYREFDGGALYYSAFKSRTIDRLLTEFADKPDLLRHVGDAMRAESVKMGNVGFKIDFFPKIPVTVILWLGDEEVPASANMLFDASAGKILPTEDLSVLGGELVSKLVSLAKA